MSKSTDILRRAITAVEEGTKVHGDTARSFEFIAQLWSTYIAHSMAQRRKVALTPFDVANMMVMVKQARSVYGNSSDNQVDMAGYAAIAAMLSPNNDVEIEKELTKAMEELGGTNESKPVRQ